MVAATTPARKPLSSEGSLATPPPTPVLQQALRSQGSSDGSADRVRAVVFGAAGKSARRRQGRRAPALKKNPAAARTARCAPEAASAERPTPGHAVTNGIAPPSSPAAAKLAAAGVDRPLDLACSESPPHLTAACAVPVATPARVPAAALTPAPAPVLASPAPTPAPAPSPHLLPGTTAADFPALGTVRPKKAAGIPLGSAASSSPLRHCRTPGPRTAAPTASRLDGRWVPKAWPS